jgi:hypothetical protein
MPATLKSCSAFLLKTCRISLCKFAGEQDEGILETRETIIPKKKTL